MAARDVNTLCVVLDAGDGLQYFDLMRHIPYGAAAWQARPLAISGDL